MASTRTEYTEIDKLTFAELQALIASIDSKDTVNWWIQGTKGFSQPKPRTLVVVRNSEMIGRSMQ